MINKVISRLQKVRYEYKRGREQKLLDNWVTIHGDKINALAYKQMSEAQKTIANYVMQKGVGVDIYDAQKAIDLGYAVKPHKNNNLNNKLLIKVTNMLNGLVDERIVTADTNKITKVERDNFVFFNIPSDGLQYTRKSKFSYEDTFLRNIYRNIQVMAEKVTK